MVVRDLHVESGARVAQVFAHEDSALLADEKSGRVGIAADVIRADGQIGDLEVLGTVDVEALVEHTVLDDRVALLGRHAAGSERVPCRLEEALLASFVWTT